MKYFPIFVRIENGQGYVYHMHVKPYKFNSLTESDPTRVRRLLLNKKELRKLASKADIKGYALVPVEVYFKDGWAKLKVALAKGKHAADKRETLKKRDLNREMEQNFRNKIRTLFPRRLKPIRRAVTLPLRISRTLRDIFSAPIFLPI